MTRPKPLKHFRITKKLSDAQIKALPTSGIQIIPAHGPGKVAVPLSCFLHHRWNEDYTNFDMSVSLGLFNGASFSPIMSTTAGDLLLSGGADRSVGLALGSTAPAPNSEIVNVPLYLKASNGGNGDFTGGNAANFLLVSATYLIEELN